MCLHTFAALNGSYRTRCLRSALRNHRTQSSNQTCCSLGLIRGYLLGDTCHKNPRVKHIGSGLHSWTSASALRGCSCIPAQSTRTEIESLAADNVANARLCMTNVRAYPLQTLISLDRARPPLEKLAWVSTPHASVRKRSARVYKARSSLVDSGRGITRNRIKPLE